jgi:hypothetical protein
MFLRNLSALRPLLSLWSVTPILPEDKQRAGHSRRQHSVPAKHFDPLLESRELSKWSHFHAGMIPAERQRREWRTRAVNCEYSDLTARRSRSGALSASRPEAFVDGDAERPLHDDRVRPSAGTIDHQQEQTVKTADQSERVKSRAEYRTQAFDLPADAWPVNAFRTAVDIPHGTRVSPESGQSHFWMTGTIE